MVRRSLWSIDVARARQPEPGHVRRAGRAEHALGAVHVHAHGAGRVQDGGVGQAALVDADALGEPVPEFVVSDVKIESGDAEGDFGFLNVEIHDPSLVMENGVELRFNLQDPGTQGADGKIRPVLWRVMPFEGVAEAHQMMRENKHLGKIAILVGAEKEGEGKTEDGPGAIRAEVG